MTTDALENIVQELRRGAIVLAVLGLLQEEMYGYEVLKRLAKRSLAVDQGTLYPLLRRLEAQQLLDSRWQLEDSRPRRYYVISPLGRRMLPQLKEEWAGIVSTLKPILS